VKKVLLLLMLIFVVFVVVERQRLFLRDPLGSVARNGVKEDGAQVFINYNNDVLLENDHPPAYVTVVQHGGHIGTPATLKCLHWVACLADADVVPLIQPLPASVDSMTNKGITYHDGTQQTKISLR
jgi:hypothetical protein